MPRAAWPRKVESIHSAPSGPRMQVVEAPRNCAWTDADGELSEDAADDLGLGGIDRALAPNQLAFSVVVLHHVVAVAKAAAGPAPLDPA